MELKLEDLYIECSACNGAGTIDLSKEPRSPGFGSHFIGGWKNCEQCGGKGGRLTPSGEALKQFIHLLNVKHL